MTSITEFLSTIEILQIENPNETFFNSARFPFYFDLFMGNCRRRTPNVKIIPILEGSATSKKSKIMVNQTVVLVTPLLKDIEFWIRAENNPRYFVNLC